MWRKSWPHVASLRKTESLKFRYINWNIAVIFVSKFEEHIWEYDCTLQHYRCCEMLQILIDFRAHVQLTMMPLTKKMEEHGRRRLLLYQLSPWYKLWKLEFPMMEFLVFLLKMSMHFVRLRLDIENGGANQQRRYTSRTSHEYRTLWYSSDWLIKRFEIFNVTSNRVALFQRELRVWL